MSTLNYTQYGLSPSFDLGLSDDAAVVRFNVILGVEDEKIVLRYELPENPELDYIPITADCLVEITLEGDQLYFSRQWDAITTKEALSSYYGGLEYDKYDQKLDRYKVVRFQARFNQGGKYGTCHAFNINVDLLQGFECDEPRWIGITIDPDIKNPPPQRTF